MRRNTGSPRFVGKTMDYARALRSSTKRITGSGYEIGFPRKNNKIGLQNGNVAMTLDKLSGIRSDLVRTDPEWEDWDYINRGPKAVDSTKSHQ